MLVKVPNAIAQRTYSIAAELTQRADTAGRYRLLPSPVINLYPLQMIYLSQRGRLTDA